MNRRNAPQKDWMEMGYVEIVDIPGFGQGVVSTQDLILDHPPSGAVHLSKEAAQQLLNKINSLNSSDDTFQSKQKHSNFVGSAKNCKRYTNAQANQMDANTVSYLIGVDDHDPAGFSYDLRSSWLGKINSSPDCLANIRVEKTEFHQIKNIYKGESLSFNYGPQFWSYALLHFEWSRLTKHSQEVIQRMNDNIICYKELLDAKLWTMHLDEAIQLIDEHTKKQPMICAKWQSQRHFKPKDKSRNQVEQTIINRSIIL
jgi:hypothetical protein